MLTISLVGQKGGTGKSTIARILINAILALNNDTETDKKILLLDADKQKSSVLFHERVIEHYPKYSKTFQCREVLDIDSLAEALEYANDNNFDYIIIDTAGSHEEFATSIMSISDKIIIPFRPTISEYESQLKTVQLYNSLKKTFENNGDTLGVAALVINDWKEADKKTKAQQEAFNVIANDKMLAPFFIANRNVFESFDQGELLKEQLNSQVNSLIISHIKKGIEHAITVLTDIQGLQHSDIQGLSND